MDEAFQFNKRAFKSNKRSKASQESDSDDDLSSDNSSEDEELLNPKKFKRNSTQGSLTKRQASKATTVEATKTSLLTSPLSSPEKVSTSGKSKTAATSRAQRLSARSTSSSSASASSSSSAGPVVALDDSSDEEDDFKVTKKSESDQDRRIRLEIEESRKARAALQTKLQTEVLIDDDDEEVVDEALAVDSSDDDDFEVTATSTSTTTAAAAVSPPSPTPSDASSTGGDETVVVKLRVIVGGEASTSTMKSVKMGVNKPFGALKTGWCKSQGYDESDVTLEFDGDVLSLSETPTDQDIEGGEIIEVKVKKGAKKVVKQVPTPPPPPPPQASQASASIIVKVYGPDGGKGKLLKIGLGAPLRVLFEGFCKAKKIDAAVQARAILVRRADQTPLDLNQTAAAQGIIEKSEMGLVMK